MRQYAALWFIDKADRFGGKRQSMGDGSMKRRLTLITIFLASLAVTSCVTAGGTQTATEPTLPVPDISSLKPEWIDGDCRSMAMTAASHSTCIAYLASQLPPFEPEKRTYFGEQYSPRKFMECALKRPQGIDGACEKYRLRRVENPEYWPYPDVPKPKWPEAPKEPVYKPGMSSKEYFEALCKAEAGEFIYKTVENVEGVYQMRPRSLLEYYDVPQQDRYVLEDPYGYTGLEADTAPYHFIASTQDRQKFQKYYSYFETPLWGPQLKSREKENLALHAPPPEGATFQRFFYSDENSRLLQKQYDSKLKSQYGFIWRGIKRPHDREMGIVGGELVVMELQTNEILGVRRGFARSGYIRNNQSGFFWLSALRCPHNEGGDYSFISKILQPAIPKN
jgi:hypothetical protein